jgi:beta-lactamase class A
MSSELRRDVAARLDSVVASAPGRVSAALTTSDGWSWQHDAERVVSAASTIKVPVLLAVLACVEGGDLELTTVVQIPAGRVGGSGPLSLLPSVTRLPLGEVLTLMIALSDNDATNAVLDLVGTEVVGELLRKVPTRHTRLERRLMDFAAIERGLQNETCAADLVEIVVALREGRLLDGPRSETALAIMRTQQFREGLPAYLPEDVSVASKTGELFGVRVEVALLERGPRWVAVAVAATDLAKGPIDRGTEVLPSFAAIGELAATLL